MKLGRGLKSDVMHEPFFTNFSDKLNSTGVTKLTFLQVSPMHEISDAATYNTETGSLLSQTRLTYSQSRAAVRLFNDSLSSNYSSIVLLERDLDKISDTLQMNDISHASNERVFLTRHYGPSLTICYCLFTVSKDIQKNTERLKPSWYMLINDLQQLFSYQKAQQYIASRKISNREKQVLSLLALGKTSSDIASQLNISPYTVGSYINVLGLKLEEKTRIGIALNALKLGIIDYEIAYSEK